MISYNLYKNLCNYLYELKFSAVKIDCLSFYKIDCHISSEKILLELYHEFEIFMPDDISRACFKRKNEFFIGRLASQQALKALNYPPEIQIEKGKNGVPIWPEGTSGSISHSMYSPEKGVSIAYAHKFDKNIGLDIEIINNNSIFIEDNTNILFQFLDTREYKLCLMQIKIQHLIFLIIFSAKESIIKAIYNKCSLLIDFHSIRLFGIDTDLTQIEFTTSIIKKIKINYIVMKDSIMTYCLI